MASRGINKVILVGRLGQDPETKHLPSGSAVTNVSLATSESWNDKATGQPVERTEWHRIVFFNRLAEIAGEYLVKGSQVYVEGSLRTRKWQDQQGNDRYSTEIVASEMQMLGGRPDGAPAPATNRVAAAPQQATPQMQNQAVGGMAPQQHAQSAYQQVPQGQQAPQAAPQQAMAQNQGFQRGMPQQQAGAQQAPQTQPFQQQPAAPMDMGSFDDDIPF